MHYNVEAGDIDLNSYLVDKTVFDIKEGYVAAPSSPAWELILTKTWYGKSARRQSLGQPKEFYGPDGSIREW
jgi:hypothetical protein